MNNLLLLFFISIFLKSYSEHVMRLRNTSLRLLISCKYKCYKTKIMELKKILFKSFSTTYDKSLHIYNNYYQLSDEDRLFIETMVGLFI